MANQILIHPIPFLPLFLENNYYSLFLPFISFLPFLNSFHFLQALSMVFDIKIQSPISTPVSANLANKNGSPAKSSHWPKSNFCAENSLGLVANSRMEFQWWGKVGRVVPGCSQKEGNCWNLTDGPWTNWPQCLEPVQFWGHFTWYFHIFAEKRAYDYIRFGRRSVPIEFMEKKMAADKKANRQNTYDYIRFGRRRWRRDILGIIWIWMKSNVKKPTDCPLFVHFAVNFPLFSCPFPPVSLFGQIILRQFGFIWIFCLFYNIFEKELLWKGIKRMI